MVLYCRDEAAGKEALPSRANALQARREASDFWQSLLLRRAKNLLSLPSLAAQLRAFLVPFTLHPQVVAKKKAQPGMVLASPVGLLGASFRFVRYAVAPLTNRRPKMGRLFPSVTNSPGCRAPMGLACSTFVSADKMPEPVVVFPLVLLWGDCLCTPQGVVGADKYISKYWETWWNPYY